ncbi:hypothetical protein B0H14DRAFT_3731063 [Mycena olivaceomarginata]|nr:hypothetical protein B0H14DRAFT_3731063 [Mycena olivaceomarginata]
MARLWLFLALARCGFGLAWDLARPKPKPHWNPCQKPWLEPGQAKARPKPTVWPWPGSRFSEAKAEPKSQSQSQKNTSDECRALHLQYEALQTGDNRVNTESEASAAGAEVLLVELKRSQGCTWGGKCSQRRSRVGSQRSGTGVLLALQIPAWGKERYCGVAVSSGTAYRVYRAPAPRMLHVRENVATRATSYEEGVRDITTQMEPRAARRARVTCGAASKRSNPVRVRTQGARKLSIVMRVLQTESEMRDGSDTKGTTQPVTTRAARVHVKPPRHDSRTELKDLESIRTKPRRFGAPDAAATSAVVEETEARGLGAAQRRSAGRGTQDRQLQACHEASECRSAIQHERCGVRVPREGHRWRRTPGVVTLRPVIDARAYSKQNRGGGAKSKEGAQPNARARAATPQGAASRQQVEGTPIRAQIPPQGTAQENRTGVNNPEWLCEVARTQVGGFTKMCKNEWGASSEVEATGRRRVGQ